MTGCLETIIWWIMPETPIMAAREWMTSESSYLFEEVESGMLRGSHSSWKINPQDEIQFCQPVRTEAGHSILLCVIDVRLCMPLRTSGGPLWFVVCDWHKTA